MENIKVGRKVNLKKTSIMPGYKGKMYDYYDVDDPEFQKEIEGRTVRVLPPGAIGTCDWQPHRMSVVINEEGIITEIRYG